MRGKQSICLFCRHAAHPRTRFVSPRCFASGPGAEPSFQSRMTNDFNKADSTFSRKEDEAQAQATAEFIEGKDTLARQLESSRQHGKQVRGSGSQRKPAFRPPKIQPIDLWAYCLLGSTKFTKHRNSEYLRQIASERNVFPFHNPEAAIESFLQAFHIDPPTNLQKAGYSELRQPIIKHQILKQQSIEKLRRMISFLSSTTDGCRLLSSNGETVVTAIRKIGMRQDLTQSLDKALSIAAVEMFNNLQINFESKGLLLGPDMCNAALYYASYIGNVGAIKKYLQLMLRNLYSPDWMARKAIRELTRAWVTDPAASRTEKRKIEMVELMTGWPGGVAPQDGTSRLTSFASLSHIDANKDIAHAIYPGYILGLGQLGLSDAIYAEYIAEDVERMSPLLLPLKRKRLRAQLFALAYLVANDDQRAWKVLKRVPQGHEDKILPTDPSRMKTWRPSICPLTSELYRPTPDSSNVWLLSFLYDHYSFYDCVPSPTLRQHLAKTIAEQPRKPRVVVELFKSLLLLDLDSGVDLLDSENCRQRRHTNYITWGEENGKACIQLDVEGGEPDAKESGKPTC